MNRHGAGPDPPQRLQHVEHSVPRILLWIVPLHDVHHAPAVPRIPSHYIDLPVKHSHSHVTLAPGHGRHHRPLVGVWAVELAAQDVVVVTAASEVIPAHDIESVSHGAHAVQPAELPHVGTSAPGVGYSVIAPKLLLEGVTGDSTWGTEQKPTYMMLYIYLM